MSDTSVRRDAPIALSVANVWKVFGPHHQDFKRRSAEDRSAEAMARDHLVGAVQDASFDIRRGEVFVIMGLSGSGKSTLLRCLTRLIEPTEGRIAFDGQDILSLGEKALAELRRTRMGMVFQHFALLPNRTVVGNITFPLEVQGMDRAKAEARARELVHVVGLAGREERLPSQLSGGQQQRVGIARSLATDPEFWFLDEPFSALDPLIRTDLQDEADQDRLIDNPKQYMTLGMDVTELRQKSLKIEQDPERCFSQRDVLVLYLAHFSNLVKQSLSESGVLDEALLRYAHPGWERASEQANGKEMKRIMAEAIALARLYPSDFSVSLELDRAKKLLAAARIASESDLPYDLLKESVREATAAGAGALLATQIGKRQAFVIVDIGAGTTDIAGCVCVHNAQHGQVRVWEVEPAAKAISSAGNVIDNALQKMILEASSLTSKTIEFERSQHALRRIIRPLKEALFTRKEVTAELPTGESIPIKLADFLATPPMVRLFDKIKGSIAEAAFLVAGSDNVVHLVPTGGGARLPFLTDLASGTLQKDGRNLQLKLRDAMPEALKEPYPDLVPVYPQLAVAVGGAVPFLPEQRQSIGEAIADPGKKTLGPVYRS